MCQPNANGKGATLMGKPMKQIAIMDPNFAPATGGGFFRNMANGTIRSQPAPQMPAAVPAVGVQPATPTTLANSFMGTAAPASRSMPNGYKVVG
jgi:hypothetical protein